MNPKLFSVNKDACTFGHIGEMANRAIFHLDHEVIAGDFDNLGLLYRSRSARSSMSNCCVSLHLSCHSDRERQGDRSRPERQPPSLPQV
jgi:hypothetical protein